MQIKNHYSLANKIELAIWVVRTKLLDRRARLIRFPFDVRGRNHIDLGHGLTTGRNCRIEAFRTASDNGRQKKIIFGSNVQINDYVHISAVSGVHIGDSTLLASHVYISDNSHGSYKGDENDTSPDIAPAERPYHTSPVKIGRNVWIGEGVIVMPGVTIGDGAVIGAHSVVNRSIPPDCIAAGSPAKAIKRFNRTTNKWEKYDYSITCNLS